MSVSKYKYTKMYTSSMNFNPQTQFWDVAARLYDAQESPTLVLIGDDGLVARLAEDGILPGGSQSFTCGEAYLLTPNSKLALPMYDTQHWVADQISRQIQHAPVDSLYVQQPEFSDISRVVQFNGNQIERELFERKSQLTGRRSATKSQLRVREYDAVPVVCAPYHPIHRRSA